MRLRSVDPSLPGYTRRRHGRGFAYLDEQGRRIQDPEILARLGSLSIPPAWSDVWITAQANGHLQATGTDAAGRRQYLYHEQWRAQRDLEKFDRMLDFARSLPRLRRAVQEDLGQPGLPRERILACAVRLLDLGLFRIGGEEYAEAGNGTFGLATLERRHVRLEAGGAIVFDYAAKGGQRRVQRILDEAVHEVVRSLKRRRAGTELLAYRNGRGWIDIRSADVNAYIKSLAGPEHSAKDFRTWHATVLAAVALALLGGRARSERARRRVVPQAVGEVARLLGNTPTVCRTSYVDPQVIERFYEGKTIRVELEALGEVDAPGSDVLRSTERSVLKLLTT